MAIKRTYGFDEFQKKISEGVEEIGFKRHATVSEHEDEIAPSVDDLGQGENISTPEETPVEETPVEETQTEDTSIDTGNREDISIDEVKVKIDFSINYIKNLQNLVSNSEKVSLDKNTKEKIVKLYNIIQGIA